MPATRHQRLLAHLHPLRSNVLKNGMDPLAFLRYLLNLGEVAHITTLTDALPEADEMDPELLLPRLRDQLPQPCQQGRHRKGLRLLPRRLRPAHPAAQQQGRGLPATDRSPARGNHAAGRDPGQERRADPGRTRCRPAPRSPGKSRRRRTRRRRNWATSWSSKAASSPRLVEAAAAKQKTVSEKKAAESSLIRIHADKLDQLIDLVGELVIAGASANLLARKSGEGTLVEATSVLSRLVESIRDSALQLRMVQIGETFNRFHRVARDVSKELGKDIELVINGAETELDKSVVEKIGDPLMHLVRNAMDHGIESAAGTRRRRQAGQGPGRTQRLP
jgi:two-component system chemotaxis sensor kinase CheA